MSDCQADPHAELLGFAGFAFRDALRFRCAQRAELVFAVALLGADALGALQPQGEVAKGLAAAGLSRGVTLSGHAKSGDRLTPDFARPTRERNVANCRLPARRFDFRASNADCRSY